MIRDLRPQDLGESNPSVVSSDYEYMRPYWEDIAVILDGTRSLRQTDHRGVSPYLPKFAGEHPEDYRARLTTAKITNFFSDTLETLASKPFTTKVELRGPSETSRLRDWELDVDGRGTSLHDFLSQWHFWGIANAIDWVLVDYPTMRPGATLADEAGVMPYLVRTPATDVLEVRSTRIGSKEVLTHFRVARVRYEQRDFVVKTYPQVWVYTRAVDLDPLTGAAVSAGPAMCQIYEEGETPDGLSGTTARPSRRTWRAVGEPSLISIGVIPAVPFITGRRIEGTWRFHRPMEPALVVQLSHFEQENGLRHAQTMTCFPVLAGNGVSPDMNPDGTPKDIFVGPRSVLYAPPSEDGRLGGWQFIEPTATSLRFLAEQLERTENNGRELGRQPLTAKADNITQITTAYAGSKSNTLSQVWAMSLEACADHVLRLVELWMGAEPSSKVVIDTDFGEDLLGNTDPALLLEMRKNGDLSRESLWIEMKRLRHLDEDFDILAEAARIAAEPPPLSMVLATMAAESRQRSAEDDGDAGSDGDSGTGAAGGGGEQRQ